MRENSVLKMFWAKLSRRLMIFVLPLLAVAAGGGDVAGSREPSSLWRALATAVPVSPLPADSGDLFQSWTAPDGREVTVRVALPRALPQGPVVQVIPGDAAAARIEAAAARLRAAGGGILSLAPGVYRIAVAKDRPGLTFADLRDLTVIGDGAIVEFDGWGTGIAIRNVTRLAIKGLSLAYVQPAVFAATVRKAGAATIVEFDRGQPLPAPGARAYQLSVLDGERGLYRGGRSRYLFYRAPLSLSPAGGRRYAVSGWGADVPDGSRVAVKLTAYLGAAVAVTDAAGQPKSSDIVFDRIAIRNGPGMGIFVARMGRGLAVVGSRFGDAGAPAATIAYDGLHVSGMDGDILVRDNVFTRTGDDAINLASPLFETVAGPQDQFAVRLRGGGLAPGADAALFDSALSYLAQGRVAWRQDGGAGGVAHVRIAASGFRRQDVRYARDLALRGNRYAVVNNRIGECECHAILAQGPNGLVRANRISDTGFNAIKIVTSAFWKEGAGAQNLLVEDNVITRTGEDVRRDVAAAAIMVYAEGAGRPPGLLSTPVHAGLTLRRNRIASPAQGCISVASAADVVLERNDCSNHGSAGNWRGGAGMIGGLRRLHDNLAHLFGANGIWIDPSTTRNVRSTDNVGV
ncbi:hypothetical protein ACX40Y_17805 [Sphingomonas sp. RS6]